MNQLGPDSFNFFNSTHVRIVLARLGRMAAHEQTGQFTVHDEADLVWFTTQPLDNTGDYFGLRGVMVDFERLPVTDMPFIQDVNWHERVAACIRRGYRFPRSYLARMYT